MMLSPNRPVSTRALLPGFPNFPSPSPILRSLYRHCFPRMLTAQAYCVSAYGHLASASSDGLGVEVGKAGMPPGCGLQWSEHTRLPIWCGLQGAPKAAYGRKAHAGALPGNGADRRKSKQVPQWWSTLSIRKFGRLGSLVWGLRFLRNRGLC